MSCDVGVYGLAVMGVNLALNVASKGYTVCVSNRTPSRVDHAIQLAKTQGLQEKLVGVKDKKEFVSLAHHGWFARCRAALRSACFEP